MFVCLCHQLFHFKNFMTFSYSAHYYTIRPDSLFSFSSYGTTWICKTWQQRTLLLLTPPPPEIGHCQECNTFQLQRTLLSSFTFPSLVVPTLKIKERRSISNLSSFPLLGLVSVLHQAFSGRSTHIHFVSLQVLHFLWGQLGLYLSITNEPYYAEKVPWADCFTHWVWTTCRTVLLACWTGGVQSLWLCSEPFWKAIAGHKEVERRRRRRRMRLEWSGVECLLDIDNNTILFKNNYTNNIFYCLNEC